MSFPTAAASSAGARRFTATVASKRLGVELQDGRGMGDAGVVDQHVETVVCGDRVGDEAVGAVLGSEITGTAGDLDVELLAEGRRLRLEVVERPARQHEPRARRGERAGDVGAESAGRAGDERAGAVEADRTHAVASWEWAATMAPAVAGSVTSWR